MYKSDILSELPVDNQHPSHQELAVIDNVFSKQERASLLQELKPVVVMAVVFALLSLPSVDAFLQRNIPILNSTYILISSKALLFAVIYYALVNFKFAKI